MATDERPPNDHRAPPPDRAALSVPSPERLFRAALPFILRMARHHGFDDQGQKDIAQDVAVALVERIDTYDPARGTELQWVLGIARNVVRHAKRTERTERRHIEGEGIEGPDSHPAPELTPEERARAHAVLHRINAALTPQQREVYELTVEGYTARDIGLILDLPATTVELRLKEARARLAVLLRKLGEDARTVTRVRGTMAPLPVFESTKSAFRAAWRRRAARWLSAALRAVLVPARIRVIGALAVASAAAGAGLAAREGSPAGVPGEQATSAPSPRAPHGPAEQPGASMSTGVDAARTAQDPALPAAPSGTAGPSGSGLPAADTRETAQAAAETARTSATSPARPPAASLARDGANAGGRSGEPPWLDPDVSIELRLLQGAFGAVPERALAVAGYHAVRFPSSNAGRREELVARALAAPGRYDRTAAPQSTTRATEQGARERGPD